MVLWMVFMDGFEYTVVSFLWMVRGIKVWGLVLENADALATLAPFVLEYMCISNVATYGIRRSLKKQGGGGGTSHEVQVYPPPPPQPN